MSHQSSFKCQFCNQEFGHKSNLYSHLKSARYCLELQGKDTSINCRFCHKSFSTVKTCFFHEQGCTDRIRVEYEQKIAETVEKYEGRLFASQQQIEITQQQCQQQIESTHHQHQQQLEAVHQQCDERIAYNTRILEEKIASLQEQLAEKDKLIEKMWADRNTQIDKFSHNLTELAKNSNSTTNHINNTSQVTKTTNKQYNLYGPLNLSPEHVTAIIDKYLTAEVIGDGQVGLANMLHEKLLTNEFKQPLYVRTDINRNHFGFQMADGSFVRDPKAQLLKTAIVKANVGAKAIDTVRSAFAKDSARLNAYLPMAIEINDLRHKDSKFRNQLSAISAGCKDFPKGDGDDEEDEEEEDKDEDAEDEDEKDNDSVMTECGAPTLGV